MQVFVMPFLSSSFPQIVSMRGTGNRSFILNSLRNRISSNGHCFSRGFGILPAFQILAGSLTVGRSAPAQACTPLRGPSDIRP